MMSIYVIAFARESFPALIFISILSLHPIVAIPIATFIDYVQSKAKQVLYLCGYFRCFDPQTTIQRFLRRLFTFTMITYLGCLTLVQWYLFFNWIDKKEFLIQNGFGSIKTMSKYKAEPFNQCPCPPDEKCDSEIDTTDEILNATSKMRQYDKAWILLGASGFFFVYHLIESFVVKEPYSKPLINFLTGRPESDYVQDEEVQKEIEMMAALQVKSDLASQNDQSKPSSDNLSIVEALVDQENSSLMDEKQPENPSNPLTNIDHHNSVELPTIIRNHKRQINCFQVSAILVAILYMVFVICCPLTFEFFIKKDLKHNENSKIL